MPEPRPRFNPDFASAEQCRAHAQVLDELAEGLVEAYEAGHFDTEHGAKALDLIRASRSRAGDLNRAALLKEAG